MNPVSCLRRYLGSPYVRLTTMLLGLRSLVGPASSNCFTMRVIRFFVSRALSDYILLWSSSGVSDGGRRLAKTGQIPDGQHLTARVSARVRHTHTYPMPCRDIFIISQLIPEMFFPDRGLQGGRPCTSRTLSVQRAGHGAAIFLVYLPPRRVPEVIRSPQCHQPILFVPLHCKFDEDLRGLRRRA